MIFYSVTLRFKGRSVLEQEKIFSLKHFLDVVVASLGNVSRIWLSDQESEIAFKNELKNTNKNFWMKNLTQKKRTFFLLSSASACRFCNFSKVTSFCGNVLSSFLNRKGGNFLGSFMSVMSTSNARGGSAKTLITYFQFFYTSNYTPFFFAFSFSLTFLQNFPFRVTFWLLLKFVICIVFSHLEMNRMKVIVDPLCL